MFELIVTLGDRQVQKYRGSGTVVSIGRDPSCDVVLDNLGVSRRHAEIRRIEGRYVLADKDSTNGVYVGDRRVTSTELSAGDTFRIAKFSLRFRPVERETPQAFDINQTIAMSTDDVAGRPDQALPQFVASVTRDVFHRRGCAWIKATADDQKVRFDTAQEARNSGRRPCKTCDPAGAEPSSSPRSGNRRPETRPGSRPAEVVRGPRPQGSGRRPPERPPTSREQSSRTKPTREPVFGERSSGASPGGNAADADDGAPGSDDRVAKPGSSF